MSPNNPDNQVRQTAITQLGISKNPDVLPTLASIGKDANRSNEERKIAIQSLDKVNIASTRSKRISVIASSSPGQAPMDQSAFAAEVVKGILGAADLDGDGLITDQELAEYVTRRARDERQTPSYSSSGSARLVLSGSKDVMVKALVIGSNRYQSSALVSLALAERDAKTISEGLLKSGAEVKTMLNPTAAQFLEALQSGSKSLKKDEVFVLYYAGHGFVQNEGNSMWLMTDTVVNDGVPSNAVDFQRVIDILEDSRANVLLLVDTFVGFDVIGSK